MRPRQRNSLVSAAGLDSFVDIVMNVMGALFFMVIYVGLSSHGLVGKITTPVGTPSQTKPVFIECRNNTVFKPDIDELLNRSVSTLSQCVGPDFSRIPRCEELLNQKPVTNRYYIARPRALKCPGISGPYASATLDMMAGSLGENSYEIQSPDSAFQRELKRLDPKRQHVVFMVRADSFAAFQAARSLARKRGFRAGWEPFEKSGTLGGGCPGGIDIGWTAPQQR